MEHQYTVTSADTDNSVRLHVVTSLPKLKGTLLCAYADLSFVHTYEVPVMASERNGRMKATQGELNPRAKSL